MQNYVLSFEKTRPHTSLILPSLAVRGVKEVGGGALHKVQFCIIVHLIIYNAFVSIFSKYATVS